MASEDFIDLSLPSDVVVEENVVHESISSGVVIESEKIVVEEGFVGITSSSECVIGSVQHDVKESDDNNEESDGQGKEEGEIEEGQFVEDMDLSDDLVVNDDVSITDSTKEVEKINRVGGRNGSKIERNGHSDVGNRNVFESPISGVKRARLTYVDQEPSVEVVYKSLTRDSKRKLEELLQQWSQWHAQQTFDSNDPNETLESGKQTLFPAIQFGGVKSSTVTFWMDNEGNSDQNKFIPLDGNSVPMYDRGFALGLTSDDGSNTDGKPDPGEAARCFNCGSYSHGLRDCKKPRDNAAVDSARKQHNSKRGQTSGARNAPRYYQDSPGGKYDGIKPGSLTSETRKALSIGELDPPPWLQRMREIGYPPGYLDVDLEDQPSGITIYADDKTLGEENGENLGTKNTKLKKKMTAEYPGINAPIPENADERRWTTLPEARHHSGSQYHTDHRRSQDYRDDGPPGVDNSPRYGGYNDPYNSPRGYPPAPILGRSLSDRGRWDPMSHSSGSPGIGPYSPVGFGSPDSLLSPPSYHSPHSYGSRHNSSSDSSRRIDRHDPHRSRRMQTTMTTAPYDSSFCFSKRYFKLKKKTDDEDHEENALYSFSSSQSLKEEENNETQINFPSLKKKRPSKPLLRLRSMFLKNQTSISTCLGTKVVCTLFGYRNGNVNFAFQEDASSDTGFFIELPAPTSSLIREMASGVVRIVLECDKLEKKGMRLLEEALWRTYCNGNKCGIAIRQEVGPEELKVLKAVGPISMGAGVIPGKEGEMLYMRAKFERVVGSRHSEAFYMMNPDGTGGPELSLYLFRG